MAERIIGNVVAFVVVAVMGIGLPRWFEWRRALVNRWLADRRAAGPA